MLLVVQVLGRQRPWRDGLAFAGALAVGVLVPVVAALLLASAWGGGGTWPAFSWHLDAQSRVALALRARYRLVAHVCGRPGYRYHS